MSVWKYYEVLSSHKMTGKKSDIIFNEIFGVDKDDVNKDEFLKLFLHDKQNELNAISLPSPG